MKKHETDKIRDTKRDVPGYNANHTLGTASIYITLFWVDVWNTGNKRCNEAQHYWLLYL